MANGDPTPPATEPNVADPPRSGPDVASGGAANDWPTQAADLVVDTVGRVRDATVGPILTIARGVVYGTAIVVIAITALVLLTIAAIRFLDWAIPGEVWSAYLVLGVVFTVAGLVVWSMRYAKNS